MLLQVIGIILGIIGFILGVPVILIIGGVLCLSLDLMGFLKGTLNPIFPIILYVLGFFLVGSWIGILLGSIVGNTIETIIPWFIILISRLKKM